MARKNEDGEHQGGAAVLMVRVVRASEHHGHGLECPNDRAPQAVFPGGGDTHCAIGEPLPEVHMVAVANSNLVRRETLQRTHPTKLKTNKQYLDGALCFRAAVEVLNNEGTKPSVSPRP